MIHAGFGPIDRVKDQLGMDQYCRGLLQVGSSLTSLVENNGKFKDVRLKVSNKCIISFMEKMLTICFRRFQNLDFLTLT